MSRLAFALHLNAYVRKPGPFPFLDAFPADGGTVALEAISSCPRYAVTPLVALSKAAARAGVGAVYYKDEAGRFGLGSFKALGGAYAVGRVLAGAVATKLGRSVTLEQLARGDYAALTGAMRVVCASDGNHGRAVAAGARAFHSRATIFFHEGVSAGREKAVTALGADVVRTRGTYDDSVRIATNIAAREGWTLIADTSASSHGADTRIPLLVMEGYRVLAMESLAQLREVGVPRPSHVFLQAGVGGLAAAMVAHLWTEFGAECPTFVVVEPEAADCLYRSAAAGRPTPALGNLATLMAGLACGEVSKVAWPILQARVDAFMTLSDAAAVDTMRALAAGTLGAPPLIAGESGVAGLAGLLALPPASPAWRDLGLNGDSQVLVIGTEGATDPAIWQALVGRPAQVLA